MGELKVGDKVKVSGVMWGFPENKPDYSFEAEGIISRISGDIIWVDYTKSFQIYNSGVYHKKQCEKIASYERRQNKEK